jgi:hypothetical protein
MLARPALEELGARLDETVPAGYLKVSNRAAWWWPDRANKGLPLLLHLAGPRECHRAPTPASRRADFWRRGVQHGCA